MAAQASFPRTLRLLKPGEFRAVFDRRLVLRGPTLACHVRDSARTGATARLGLVVPKRTAAKAVLRNRIKRVARETFRKAASDLPALDLIIRLTAKLPENSPREQKRTLAGEVERLLARVRRQSA